MSYQEMPDPRPLGVKYALGRMPRAIAMTLMFSLAALCMVAVIGLCLNHDQPIPWGAAAIAAGLLTVQYFIAIRWADFHKAWPRRRTYRKHRTTHS